MKFSLSILFALASVHSALGNEIPCEKDAQLLNAQYTGAKYTHEIQSQLTSGEVRIIHPEEFVTANFLPNRLNVHVDEEGKVLFAKCG